MEKFVPFLRLSLSTSQRGKKINLTSQISSQIERAEADQSRDQLGSSYPPSRLKLRKNRTATESWKAYEERLVRQASAKLQEGDIRGAIRCLNADETLAKWCDSTFQALQAKHSSAPANRRPFPIPSSSPMSVSVADVRNAIKSFPPGSAGGRDGLRPQHLKDLTDNQGGTPLCEALRDFSNLVLAGRSS